MNSNDNKNEFEIMDNGHTDYQPRYPLMQVTGSALQNMDYKDWMNMSSDGNLVNLGAGYNASIRDSIITTLSITSYLCSLAPPPVGPAFSAAAGILSVLLGFLWPSGTQSTWEAFMNAVEQLINQKLSDYARSKAISELEGLQDALTLYLEAVEDWEKDKNDGAAQERVRTYFRALNLDFVNAIPQFRIQGYEAVLLAVFAQAADLHLLLIRDGFLFGAGWGFKQDEIDDLYVMLQSRTRDYTDYCVFAYNKGLDEAKKLIGKLNPEDFNKYPYLNPYTKDFREQPYYTHVLNWNVVNDFRRDMTIMAMDIVSLWPTYDPKLYSNPHGTASQLSREVYSIAYGKVGENWENWEVIESVFVRPPHLVTWLSNLEIYMSVTTINNPDQYGGVKNTLSYTGSSTTWKEGFYNNSSIAYIASIPAQNIGGLIATVQAAPCRLRFLDSFGRNIAEVGNPLAGLYTYILDESISTPSSNKEATHRLSFVNAIDASFWTVVQKSGWGLSTWGFGWVHASLTPENMVLSDKTTQIPAVKGYVVEHGATVVKGPGSTGGDLVKLPAYNNQWTQLRIKVKPVEWAKGKAYKLRIRYASETNANLFVGKYVDATNRFWETGNYAVGQTFSGSMTYDSFKYLDTFSFTANENEFKIELRCNSGGPIYIDKIEFIPVTPEPESPVLTGTYQIVTALNNSSVATDAGRLTQGGPYQVKLSSFYNSNSQKWEFIYDSNEGVYKIRNLSGGFLAYLMLHPGYPVLALQPDWNSDTQKWILKRAGINDYYLISKYAPTEAAFAPNDANETILRMSAFNSSTNQKFTLKKL